SFFFNYPLSSALYTLSLHDALPISQRSKNPKPANVFVNTWSVEGFMSESLQPSEIGWGTHEKWMPENGRTHAAGCGAGIYLLQPDRKSTRLNSSHVKISYAVFCLKK